MVSTLDFESSDPSSNLGGTLSQLTPWRNGSASDSRSEGCVFKSRRGHLFSFLNNTELHPHYGSKKWFVFYVKLLGNTFIIWWICSDSHFILLLSNTLFLSVGNSGSNPTWRISPLSFRTKKYWFGCHFRTCVERQWYSGEHSCLPSSWPGFDSRLTHFHAIQCE